MIVALHVLLGARYGTIGALSLLAAFVGVVLMVVGTVGANDLPLNPFAANLEGEPPSMLGYVFLLGLLIASIGIPSLGTILLLKDEEIAAYGVPWWHRAMFLAGSPLRLTL